MSQTANGVPTQSNVRWLWIALAVLSSLLLAARLWSGDPLFPDGLSSLGLLALACSGAVGPQRRRLYRFFVISSLLLIVTSFVFTLVAYA